MCWRQHLWVTFRFKNTMPSIINIIDTIFFNYIQQTYKLISSVDIIIPFYSRRWGYLINISSIYSCLDKKRNKVLHPVIVSVCKRLAKISDNTDLGSRLATRWAGNHFITLAVPGSIRTSIFLSPRFYSNNINKTSK